MYLVYKAMGESLSRFQSRIPKKRYPLSLMKKITQQLLQVLDHVHSCGFVHTGRPLLRSASISAGRHRLIGASIPKDISPRNILTELDEDVVLAKYLLDVPTPADSAKIGPISPIPTTQMRAPNDYLQVNIRLADFGEA